MVKGSLTTARNERKISPDEILTKIRDDGDFDRLRLKIIRQLKDDGELRDMIGDMVKQSAALNQAGAENMKPRQLSDAIHQEIGEQVMAQISNGLWNVIRSPHGIKQQVTETVQLVYNKLANPGAHGETSALMNSVIVHKGHDHGANRLVEASCVGATLSDCEPNEPPGYSIHEYQNIKGVPNGQHKEIQRTPDGLEHVGIHHRGPHESLEPKHLDYGSDDGPDLPPGFT